MRIKDIILFCLLSVLFSSCNQAYSPLTNGAYLGEAVNENLKKVTIQETGAETSVYVALASPVEYEVKARVGINPEVLLSYNKKHGTNYKVLPAEYYNLSNDECVVKPGELSSSLVNINIKAFDDKLEPSEKYAIPLELQEVSGVDILQPSSSMVLLCDKIIVTKVLYSAAGGATGASPTMSYEVKDGEAPIEDLLNWTIEFLVYNESFSLNRHILRFDGLDGKANTFARFGQHSFPENQFQLTLLNLPIHAVTLCENKKWYHVAITCDGASIKLYLNGELDVVASHPEPNTKITWQKLAFAIGNPGALSEARIWNVTRSQAEIANNMYAVNPQSEGLISYWKMNDGSGNIIHDYTDNGRDMKLLRSCTWKEEKFPPEQ